MSTGSPTGQRVAPAASTSPAATVAQSGRLPRHHKVSVIATITRKPQQGVDHHAYGQAHQVLNGGDHGEAVERPEHEQEDAVPGKPGDAGDVVQRGGQIRRGVAPEPDRGREAEHRDQPGRQAEAEHGGKQAVPAQG